MAATTEDKDKQTPPVPKKSEHVRVDMHNPTTGRRVFYDGIPDPNNGNKQRCISLETGEAKKNVLVHKDIVREMMTRNRKKANSDIIMTAVEGNDAD